MIVILVFKTMGLKKLQAASKEHSMKHYLGPKESHGESALKAKLLSFNTRITGPLKTQLFF